MVDVYVVKSIGVKNVDGEFKEQFHLPYKALARFQADRQVLEHITNTDQNYSIRRIYINTSPHNPISELNRIRAKTGDYIYRLSDKTWWLITETVDEFSPQGWVCVRGALQVIAPVVELPTK